MHSNILKDIHLMVSFALGLLTISFLLSLASNYHWFADLFSHFHIQYMIGGFLIAAWFTAFKKWRAATLSVFIALCSCYILFSNFSIVTVHDYSASKSDKPKQTFTVLHYNRKYTLQNHDALLDTLKSKDIDVAVVQEATQSHSKALTSIKDIYPFQIHEPRINAFGMVAVSKCPIQEQRVKAFDRIALDNIQLRIRFKCDGQPPVTLYSIHPPPPTTKALNAQRNMELRLTSYDVKNDESENIIMMGDWNITPFSPPFQEVVKTTELKHEHTQFPPFMTWPSQFALPIFQIPIDHVLYKGRIQLTDKRRLHAMASDHYPVVATFKHTQHD